MLRLWLASPKRAYLCLVFDPLSDRPYMEGANTEEVAIVNLIAEQEAIEPTPSKKWNMFLGESGSVVFAIAPLYSTFLRQKNGVSCHPACLLLPHCLLSRPAVTGCVQLPQDRLWLLGEITQAALHYRNSAHAFPIQTTPSRALAQMYARPYCTPSRSTCFFCDDTVHIACPEFGVHQFALHATVLCPSEICVALGKQKVQFIATLACIVLAFALGDWCAGENLPLVDEDLESTRGDHALKQKYHLPLPPPPPRINVV